MGRRNRVAKSTERVLKRSLSSEWRTAVYARLSNENNGLEDDRSLQNQIKYIKEYIQKIPTLELVGLYVDNGETGTSFERPEFLRLMEDIRAGRVNCIVVKDLSRFGRNYLEAGYYLEKIFPMLDVRFIAINDNYDSMDDTKKDGLLIPIKNMINEMYAKETARKIKASYKVKRRRGEIRKGRPPYGYVKDPKQSYRLLPDERTSPFVKLAFELVAADLSTSEVARRLTEKGAPTATQRKEEQLRGAAPQEGRWVERAVKEILRNPVYMGDTVYEPFENEEALVFPDTHEPLVSRKMFEEVQEILERKRLAAKEKMAKRAELRMLNQDVLQGVFYCADCGRMMKYNRRFNGDTLRCGGYQCNSYESLWRDFWGEDVPQCRKKYQNISDRMVRCTILRHLKMQIMAGYSLEAMMGTLTEKRAKEAAARKQQLAGVEHSRETLAAKTRRLYEDLNDGLIEKEEYAILQKRYKGKMEELQQEAERLQREIEECEQGCMGQGWEEAKRFLESQKPQEWQTDTSGMRVLEEEDDLFPEGLTREVVETFIERVEYSSGSFTIVMKTEDWLQRLAETMARE